MKYIWIIILALIEIVWFLSSISDIYLTLSIGNVGKNNLWYNLMETTRKFITIHLVGLFAYLVGLFFLSLLTWIDV